MLKFSGLFASPKRTRSAGAIASHLTLGDAARDNRDWKIAALNYRAHLQDNPQDFGIWVQYGHTCKESGQLEEAALAYETADKLTPNDADLILNQGHLAKLQGQSEKALAFYLRSATLNPKGPAKDELALLKQAQSQVHEAEAEKLEAPSKQGHGKKKKSEAMVGASVGSVDSCEAGTISGWVSCKSEEPVTLEFLVKKRVIARGTPTFHRPDVEAAGFGGGLTGFRLNLSDRIRIGDVIDVRVKGEKQTFGSTTAMPPATAKLWLERNDKLSRDALLSIKQRCDREVKESLLTFILPIMDVSDDLLKEALDSLLDQWCGRWEALCVTNKETDAEILETLVEFGQIDSRIQVVVVDDAANVSALVNAGLDRAKGGYMAVHDPKNILEPEAVYRLLDAARAMPGLIYTDAALISDTRDAVEGFSLRPAFSYDYLLGYAYINGLICVDTDVARSIGGYDVNLQQATELDFVLRVIETSNSVVHVPAPLFRIRKLRNSTTTANRKTIQKAGLTVVRNHLVRSQSEATAEFDEATKTIRVDYPDRGGKTLIIIPTKDRVDLLETCLESLWKTTKAEDVDVVVIDHESREPESLRYFKKIAKKVKIYPYRGPFNFGRMNNQAFNDCWDGHEYVLCLNNDIECISEGWLERMRAHAARSDVGVVGANLRYGDGRVQHSGVIIGMNGAADHGHKLVDFEDNGQRLGGYENSLTATRDYSAVTAACMLMRSEVFKGIAGYDDALEIGFNDTDICLRVASLGYRVLNEANAVLYHHESATRSNTATLDHPEDSRRFMRRWQEIITVGDPFYNPLLSSHIDYRYGDVADMYHPPRHRKVHPRLRPLSEGIPRQVPGAISLIS